MSKEKFRHTNYMNNAARPMDCEVCNDGCHEIKKCSKFISLPIYEKWEVAKRLKLCFQCLVRDHHRMDCQGSKCQYCMRPHDSMLHNSFKTFRNPVNHEESTHNSAPGKNVSVSVTIPRCYLPIVKATVVNERIRFKAITILDSGSELNVISTRLYNKLGLKGSPVTVNIVGITGTVTQKNTLVADVMVEDQLGVQTMLQCIVLDKTCGKALPLDKAVLSLVKEENISEKQLVSQDGEIELLIGMNTPRLHQQISMHGKKQDLLVIETRFGPSIVGRAPMEYSGNYECGTFDINKISICEEEKNLWKIVESEIIGSKTECNCNKMSDEEIIFENCMKDGWSIDENGNFIVKIPWKKKPTEEENNRNQVIIRSKTLEKKLSKNPEVKELFDNQVNEMVENGVLRTVDDNYPIRYIPLLAVVDLKRDSTKVRVCLDSKSKYFGHSLNDFLLKGKHVTNDILQITLRFRSGRYVLIGDVKKMFWQFKIHEDDQRYHGVICNGNTYVFTRVCFGNKSSPPIAENGMIKIADHGKSSHPLASSTLKRYIDDIIDANNDENVLMQTRDEIDDLLGQFGFDIKKWNSNSPEVGEKISFKKILGVKFNLDEDKLGTEIKEIKQIYPITKRRILSRIAEAWDPLGIKSGVLLTGKLICQSASRLDYKWDEPIINDELMSMFMKWNDEIQRCNNIHISRCILPDISLLNEKLDYEIYGFSDGSNVGYGCVNYIKLKNMDETIIDIKFLCAKAKVSPIKGNTIPRNELCGALNLARLIWSTVEGLKRTDVFKDIDFQKIKLKTDSTTVLSWVKSPATMFKPYVKNKVIEIQNLIPSSCWGYVPSRKNKSADFLSKGCSSQDLDMILQGPDILRVPDDAWPKLTKQEEQDECEKELVILKQSIVGIVGDTLLNIDNFESWKKMIRVTAYILRFIRMARKKEIRKNESANDYFKDLTDAELNEAEIYWIKQAQMLIDESEKGIMKFNLFNDELGIKRILGRIKESNIFDYNRKHPILLPYNSKITRMILVEIHNRLHHPGHNRVLAESRTKYWIINGRRLAKSIGNDCILCKRWRGKELGQIMANLPKARIQYRCSPFENVAIDYFGPFFAKFRRKQRIKNYGMIFTCLTTRAVYIDMASDLSTDTFLLALKRLISWYGIPKHIQSDNGSNFRGAALEIKRMIESWKSATDEQTMLREYLVSNKIKWSFCTPIAPHRNGLVTAMVKSVKSSLNKIVKDKVLREEFRTILVEIQDIINSRPLWTHNDGDIDEPPITGNDLIRPKCLIPQTDQFSYGNPRTRFNHIQQVVNEWWKIWLRNFVPNLQIRSKWWKPRENLKAGDIVLLIDPNVKRGKWQLGLVEETYAGKDNRIRSVKVKTSTGIYARPITKLSLLISKEEQNENNVGE